MKIDKLYKYAILYTNKTLLKMNMMKLKKNLVYSTLLLILLTALDVWIHENVYVYTNLGFALLYLCICFVIDIHLHIKKMLEEKNIHQTNKI